MNGSGERVYWSVAAWVVGGGSAANTVGIAGFVAVVVDVVFHAHSRSEHVKEKVSGRRRKNVLVIEAGYRSRRVQVGGGGW